MGIKRVKKDEFEYFRKKVSKLNKEVVIIQMAFIFVLGIMALKDLL
tara:strand:- start:256 stop:393 length:138 start_codon:yes stop_codon:yes gene_type:complete